MSVITISSGAHWRNTGLEKHADYSGDQFAHIFDPESPEDVPHEAQNFLAYMKALGRPAEPLVLIAPEDPLPEWIAPVEPLSARHFGPEEDHVNVMMADWCQIVATATGMKVAIL